MLVIGLAQELSVVGIKDEETPLLAYHSIRFENAGRNSQRNSEEIANPPKASGMTPVDHESPLAKEPHERLQLARLRYSHPLHPPIRCVSSNLLANHMAKHNRYQ